MTALGNLLAGQRLTAAEVQGVAPAAAYKGAQQSVTSSTTLVNDSALFLSLPANSTWIFLSFLYGTGAANGSGDLKVAYTWPAGASGVWVSLGLNVGALTPNLNAPRNSSAASVSLGLNGGTLAGAVLLGSVLMSSTPGNLQTQWAQNASSVTASNISAGSWLAAWQIA